ncbi:MAG: hypothetical protein H0V18_01305 [Pyrinomonadaceae bacterium]|nr:hypothetical protein [Pyrinomonadaceae bacterium]
MREAFAHDVPAEAFARVRPLIVPEPTTPLRETISVSEEKWGQIPRYYVECTADNAIPSDVQRAMYTAIPVKQVFSLKTSHAPNFSAPKELAGYLQIVAEGEKQAAAR